MVTITDVSRLGWERWGPATGAQDDERRATEGGKRRIRVWPVCGAGARARPTQVSFCLDGAAGQKG